MRHGLIHWDESEVARADIEARQARMQAALAEAGLDALIVYTNHVRSGAVTWLTGFTPYWSDGLLMLPAKGAPVFATALSRRVGRWIVANNPTADVMHSPRPGVLLARQLAAGARLGVVELDRLPNGLVDEIASAGAVEFVDASGIFAAVRARSDGAELRLAARADGIARQAFAAAPELRTRVGDVTEALELSVRRAGAEECYVATAADLLADPRMARRKGDVALGERFAVRLSVAYRGVWVRRIETFCREGDAEDLEAARGWADDVLPELPAGPGTGAALAAARLPEGLRLEAWRLEAPVGTRPLQVVADGGAPATGSFAYGVLTVQLRSDAGPVVLARPAGLAAAVA